MDFNPRSPHGERPVEQRTDLGAGYFNPRSPHGERRDELNTLTKRLISIHAPRTGSDLLGATAMPRRHYFNPRSPHGERRNALISLRVTHDISIHAPRTGSDSTSFCNQRRTKQFQSTLPARGATERCPSQFLAYSDFNPRSPHGERHCAPNAAEIRNNFNPRSPHGERHCHTAPAV